MWSDHTQANRGQSASTSVVSKTYRYFKKCTSDWIFFTFLISLIFFNQKPKKILLISIFLKSLKSCCRPIELRIFHTTNFGKKSNLNNQFRYFRRKNSFVWKNKNTSNERQVFYLKDEHFTGKKLFKSTTFTLNPTKHTTLLTTPNIYTCGPH